MIYGQALGKAFIFFLWIGFMLFLAKINVHPMIGGLVLVGGILLIVKELGVYDV